jgi:subtilisin family serine protease
MAPLLRPLIALTLIAAPAAAADRPQLPTPPTAALARPAAAALPTLSPLLNQLYDSRFGPAGAGRRRVDLGDLMSGPDRVRVVVEALPGQAAAALSAISESGGEASLARGRLLFATVPVAQLPLLASSAGVLRVRTPGRGTPDVVSEGVPLHHADTLHAAGITGAGTRVGVLDCGGFVGYEALLGNELPATTALWPVGGVGDGVHGTACAEIVADMAPGAQLFLAHDPEEEDFYSAVDWLLAQGVDVISYSCSWFGPYPYDGSGAPHNPVAATVEAVRDAGVLWVNSSGNYALDDSYQAQFTDAGGEGWHDFDDYFGNGVYMRTTSTYGFYLTWSDWPDDPATQGSSQDYALQIWRWNTATSEWDMVESNNPQTGVAGQVPYEELTFTPPADDWYYVAIWRVDTTRDCFMSLRKDQSSGFVNHNPEYSVTTPGDSPDALTAGAVFWPDQSLEVFSSQGPTLGPGGVADGGFLKPDLVAADGTSGVTYGISDGVAWPDGTGFFGTSASCPHVAGGAALLLSATPGLGVDEVEAQLLGTAVDLGPAGPDTQYGYGLMNLSLSGVLFADGFESGDLSAWSAATP